MPLVCVAFGSNLGNRERSIRRAASLLVATPGIEEFRLSSLHESPSVGGPADAPAYLNAAAAFETTLPPWDLLVRLMAIELTLGRRRPDLPDAPRPIDLDLLLHGDAVLDDPRLTLPHPRMWGRDFVLRPLGEVAPAGFIAAARRRSGVSSPA